LGLILQPTTDKKSRASLGFFFNPFSGVGIFSHTTLKKLPGWAEKSLSWLEFLSGKCQ
jgi:hypothetical protein